MNAARFRITVGDKILIHLGGYSGYRGQIDIPAEITQDGMAKVVGVDRSHIAISLKKLIEKGYVEESSGRVRGEIRRKKAYFLSPQGAQNAVVIIQNILQKRVIFINEDHNEEEMEVIAIRERVPNNKTIIDILNNISRDAVFDISEMELEQDDGEEPESVPVVQAIPASSIPDSRPVSGIEEPFVIDIPAAAMPDETIIAEDPMETGFSGSGMDGSGVYAIMPPPPADERTLRMGVALYFAGAILLAVSLSILAALMNGFVTVATSDSVFASLTSVCVIVLLLFIAILYCLLVGYSKLRDDPVLAERANIALLCIILFPIALIAGKAMGAGFEADALIGIGLIGITLFPVIIFARQVPEANRVELGVFAGVFLILFGVFSGIFTNLTGLETNPVHGPLWALLGAICILTGYEIDSSVFRSAIAVAVSSAGLFIVFMAILFTRNGYGHFAAIQYICAALWLAGGAVIAGVRVYKSSKDDILYGLKVAVPFGISVLIGFLGIILMMGTRYAEGIVELLLSAALVMFAIKPLKELRANRTAFLVLGYFLVVEAVSVLTLFMTR